MSEQIPPPVLPQWTPPPVTYGYPYAAPKPTSGLAIGSMVTSIVGVVSLCFYGVPGILLGPIGAILGHVAKRQIRERGLQGEGMATAGMILGWIATALGLMAGIALVALFVWAGNQPPVTR